MLALDLKLFFFCHKRKGEINVGKLPHLKQKWQRYKSAVYVTLQLLKQLYWLAFIFTISCIFSYLAYLFTLKENVMHVQGILLALNF